MCPPVGLSRPLTGVEQFFNPVPLRTRFLNADRSDHRYLWRSTLDNGLLMWMSGPGWCRRKFGQAGNPRGTDMWDFAGTYRNSDQVIAETGEVFIRVAERIER